MKYRISTALLTKIPPPYWNRLTRVNPIVFYYHLVCDSDIAHVRHLYRYKGIKQFRDELDFILKYYAPVSLTDVIDHIKIGTALPNQAFMLSFDDGFREMHDIVAPILLEKGIPAVFFISSGFIDNRDLCFLQKASLLVERLRDADPVSLLKRLNISEGCNFRDIAELTSWLLNISYREKEIIDRFAWSLDVDFDTYLRHQEPYLTSTQIRKLITDGFAIGAHSIDHPLYATIGIDEQLRQTVESVQSIRVQFGLPYGAFAFPHKDNGVSKEFFHRLEDYKIIDLTFGTGGMIADSTPRHLQRCSLESPFLPADKLITLEYARKMKRIVMRTDKVIRN